MPLNVTQHRENATAYAQFAQTQPSRRPGPLGEHLARSLLPRQAVDGIGDRRFRNRSPRSRRFRAYSIGNPIRLGCVMNGYAAPTAVRTVESCSTRLGIIRTRLFVEGASASVNDELTITVGSSNIIRCIGSMLR
jgi:hypothetical protein